MGIFDRFEGRLERAVNGVFSRAFRSEVEPIEIAAAIRRAMDDRAAIVAKGRTFVPNVFTVELATTDYDRLAGYEDLESELVAAAAEHADSQRYTPPGRFRVDIVHDEELETGVFRIRPQAAKVTGTTNPPVTWKRPDPIDDDDHGYAEAEYDDAGDADDADDADDDAGYDDAGNASADDGQWFDDYDEYTDHGGYADPEPPAPAAPVPSVAPARPAPPAPPVATPARPAAHQPPATPPRRKPLDCPWLEVDGDRYLLTQAVTVVGRDDTVADVILDDPGISRRHSEIRVTGDGPHLVASIRDLNSTNGTFVNGERITSDRLESGDRITVGRTNLTYRAGRGR